MVKYVYKSLDAEDGISLAYYLNASGNKLCFSYLSSLNIFLAKGQDGLL